MSRALNDVLFYCRAIHVRWRVIVTTRMSKADELLAVPPDNKPIDMPAAKL
jgi:hypothetical protein